MLRGLGVATPEHVTPSDPGGGAPAGPEVAATVRALYPHLSDARRGVIASIATALRARGGLATDRALFEAGFCRRQIDECGPLAVMAVRALDGEAPSLALLPDEAVAPFDLTCARALRAQTLDALWVG